MFNRFKRPIPLICENCGKRRVWGFPCDCEAPQDTPPPRGQMPTTEHYGYGKLITEEEVKRAER
jgi:hypothetical protein